MSTELSKRYRDTITGYSGTATARTEFLYDTPSIRLTAQGRDGKPEDVWFSESRLELTDDGKKVGFGAIPDLSDPSFSE